MFLVDTSVWIDHLHHGESRLSEALFQQRVLIHPFVVGELALGNLRHRDTILEPLGHLPEAVVGRDEEVRSLIESQQLFGCGIGYVDAHLLASVRLTPGSLLWTRDRRLGNIANRMGIEAELE
jgi:predicted nucleic acid-binding protein